MNNVLFIAYQIPPIAGPAAQRHLRFLSNLYDFEWNPIVLTVDPEYSEDYYNKDPSLTDCLDKNIRIHRTMAYNPMDRFLERRKANRSREGFEKSSGKTESGIGEDENWSAYLQTLKDLVSESFRIPDRQIGWLPFAVFKGAELIRKNSIDVIYSSGNPWTTHLVGLVLSRLSCTPWIPDFRDPWMNNPYRGRRFGFIEKIERRFERMVVEKARFVVCNTQPLKEQFQVSYPYLDSAKFVHISNGYLKKLFDHLDYSKQDNRLRITHVGNLYSRRSPESLLIAVSNLKKSGVINASNFVLSLVGKIDIPGYDHSLLEELGIADIVELVPFVPHNEALNRLAQSDILLIIQPDTALQIPGKLFEYIAIGHPVFALTGEGATAEFIRSENLGVVVHPQDTEGIQAALKDYVFQHAQGLLPRGPDGSDRMKFESRSLTERLVELFKICLREN